MTIQSETYRKEYTSTGGTTYPYTWRIQASTWLAVYVDEVLQATGYSVTGVGDGSGGSVVFDTAPVAGTVIVILPNVPITQLTDYVENDKFAANTHEDALDKLTLIAQQQQEQLDRTVAFPPYSSSSGGILPEPVLNQALRWSAVTPPTLQNYTVEEDPGGLTLPLTQANGGFGQDVSAKTGMVEFRAGTAYFPSVYCTVTAYGATGDGTTDDTAAVQAAIDAAYAAGVPVLFPPGYYKITTTINCANKRGLQLIGSHGHDTYGVTITGAATGKPILDLCGAHGALLDGFHLKSTTSTIGILTGYTTVDNCGGLTFRNLYIEMHNDKTANSNAGTIGICNKSGEGITYERIFVVANLPMYLSDQADTSWLRGTLASTYTVASDYATLDTMTCGLHHFVGNNQLWALGHHRPCIASYNAGYLTAGNLYCAGLDAASDNGTYTVALQWQSAVGWHIAGGDFENIVTPIDCHYAIGCDVSLFTNDATAANGQLVNLYGGAGGGVVNSRFRMGTLGTSRVLAGLDGTDPLSASAIRNTEFLGDSATANDAIPVAGVQALCQENVRFANAVENWTSSISIKNDGYLKGFPPASNTQVPLLGIEADGAVHLNTAPLGIALNVDTDAAMVTGTAGAVSQYLTVIVNDVTYKIPLYATA